MADVFISYHEESAGELAEQIADALDDAGISAWCARRDLPFADSFADEIPKQIHACRLFLLILNESVYQSEHIKNELGIAFSRRNKQENILILPLELGDFTRKGWIEYYLIHTQSVKFLSRPNEQRIQRLVKRILWNLSSATQSTLQKPYKIIKRGECGDKVTYALDDNGVLTISGFGSMWSFDWDKESCTRNTPWWNEQESISCVRIQHGVTEIGHGAFDGCIGLSSVIMPNSLIGIGMEAFCKCERLTSIDIPDRVVFIGRWAFANCENLTDILIPSYMTYIAEGTFCDCVNLTSVYIHHDVTRIGYKAFWGCKNLTRVIIPADTELENYAFPRTTDIIRRFPPRRNLFFQ